MIRQHILSVVGQVAAALPPVLLLVILSRTVGLESAGLFAVAAGISAAAFSTAHWGLRTSVVLDRFESTNARTYLNARLVALMLAAVVVAVVAGILDIDNRLIAGLILYKICDGLVDLDFAITQVLSDTAAAIRSFGTQHLIKLLLLVGGVAISLLLEQVSVPAAFAFSGLIALGLLGHRIFRHIAANSGSGSNLGGIWQVFTNAAWFAIAAGLCSIVTSAPRFSLAWLYEGEVLGIVGVTLSVSTFFGMIFYTTWARYFPHFNGRESFRTQAARFLSETALIAAAIFVVSWYLLPQIVSFIFGYEESAQLSLTRRVLAASIVFFAGMNTCNLYKVTAAPWMESVSYALALIAAVVVALVNPDMRETHLLLMISGLVMVMSGLLAIAAPVLLARDRINS